MVQLLDGTLLRENNPYSIGSLFQFDEGDMLLDGPDSVVFTASPKDRYYTVEQNDTLWTIAFKAYGNSKWWWILLFANELEFGMEIETGKTLLIPNLENAKISTLNNG